MPLVTCPLWGQAGQKKTLTVSDYNSFGVLTFDNTSKDGKWASFRMTYQNGIDTLFIKNTASGRQYTLLSASNTHFFGNDHFVYQTQKGVVLLDLQNGRQQHFESVSRYEVNFDSTRLIIYTEKKAKKGMLNVLDQNGKSITFLNAVTDFKISPCGKKLLYCSSEYQNNVIAVLDLSSKSKKPLVIKKSIDDLKMLIWSDNSQSVAFLAADRSSSEKISLVYYSISKALIYHLELPSNSISSTLGRIDSSGKFPLNISCDTSRVFFWINPVQTKENLTAEKDRSKVEIWNGNDKWIYPMEKIKGQFDKKLFLAAWSPSTGEVLPISSDTLPKVMLAGNDQYALLSNPKAYEPQFDIEGPRDFYLRNLNTAETKLILQKQLVSPMEIQPITSAGGKYISYFKDNNWQLYDIFAETHTNITDQIKEPFYKEVTLGTNSPYGIAGWTTNDKEIILYDQYDIWVVKPDGSDFKRLTRGREKQIRFRILQSGFKNGLTDNYNGWSSSVIDISKALILEAKGDDGKTGYFQLKANSKEVPIVYKPAFIDQFFVSGNKGNFIYKQQKFDQSPALMLKKQKTEKVLFQSNPQQKKYKWGTTELLSYENQKGEKLSSVLYFPSDFDAQKKYPMIVWVYEIQKDKLYKYSNPTLENESGFNPTLLTSQGYFVLCPDIIRHDMQEGMSALDCTLEAVKTVISKGYIEADKIGLIGHSFGGFESSFIISHTNIFRAAVAGSAINNLNVFYHTINWKSGFPAMNYFQNGQFKMMKPPYENPGQFLSNSPLNHVSEIRTPLLSYAGKNDTHVDWHQSIELYLALRRLNKKTILLLYPDESHLMLNAYNQKDLTLRILDWFNYFLKDQTAGSWITQGIM